MVVCPLAVASALVGRGCRHFLRFSGCLSLCVVNYGQRNADAFAFLGVHIVAVDVFADKHTIFSHIAKCPFCRRSGRSFLRLFFFYNGLSVKALIGFPPYFLGLALALIWIYPPFRLRISFDVLLLACKGACRCSHSIDARPLCQTSGCSVYSTYNYLRYLSSQKRARAKRQKKPCVSTVFGVFALCFSPFFNVQRLLP